MESYIPEGQNKDYWKKAIQMLEFWRRKIQRINEHITLLTMDLADLDTGGYSNGDQEYDFLQTWLINLESLKTTADKNVERIEKALLIDRNCNTLFEVIL